MSTVYSPEVSSALAWNHLTQGAGSPLKVIRKAKGCPQRTVTSTGVIDKIRGGLVTGPSKARPSDRLDCELDSRQR